MLAKLRRSFAKNWIEVDAFLRGGMPGFVYRRRPRPLGAEVPVFCYHNLDPETLTLDMAFLKRNGYATITADELADHMEERRPSPRNAVVISIDDGTEDLYSVGFPVLRTYSARVVAFVCPGLHADHAEQPDARDRLCTWPEISEMHSSGLVDFQSHTWEHRFVPQWPRMCSISTRYGPVSLPADRPARRMAEDFAASKQMLERRLEKRVDHLAFPQYTGSDEAIEVGRACGFRGFWWGHLPRRQGNGPADPTSRIVRLSGEFLRRLPGVGRESLRSILARRGARSLSRRQTLPRPVHGTVAPGSAGG